MGNYVKANVAKPEGMPGRGITPKDQIFVIDVDDIDTFPVRDAAGVVIAEDIVMKESKVAVGVYLTPGSATLTSNSEETPTLRASVRPSSSRIPATNRRYASSRRTGWVRTV